MNRHFEGEQLLLKQGSRQSDLWGGGVDLETKMIDYNSFINIRPNDGNMSNEIQNYKTRARYESLSQYFFENVYVG